MTLEIESKDVIRLMLQFCKENGLARTYETLRDETQVTLNSVDSVETFVSDVHEGRWDAVLAAVTTLQIPQPKLMDLYEQIVIELIEMREFDTARSMLRQMKPLQAMRSSEPNRHSRLEALAQRSMFDEKEAYGDSSKSKRRRAIAKALSSEVRAVAPGRLLSLIAQALHWQQYRGVLPKVDAYDLFADAAAIEAAAPPLAMVRRHARSIRFGKQSAPLCAAFSPDGQSLATGSVDGFVEIWQPRNGKLRRDLPYQNNDDIMMHESSVLCVGFSIDSELLASGASDGNVKVWSVATGQCIRRFDHAHAQGITAISFMRDASKIVTCSFDETVSMHGLKSGKTLKVFRGHTAFVNTLCVTPDDQSIISGGSDAFVRVWDARTAQCTTSFQLGQDEVKEAAAIESVSLLRQANLLLVCNRSASLHVVTLSGALHRKYATDGATADETFVCCVAAPDQSQGFIYALTDKGNFYVFNTDTARIEYKMHAHDAEPVSMVHHPHQSIVASFARNDRELKLFQPADD